MRFARFFRILSAVLFVAFVTFIAGCAAPFPLPGLSIAMDGIPYHPKTIEVVNGTGFFLVPRVNGRQAARHVRIEKEENGKDKEEHKHGGQP